METGNQSEQGQLLGRIASALERIAQANTPTQPDADTDWQAPAFRWQRPGRLCAIHDPQVVAPDQLLGIDRQKSLLLQNTRQFLAGAPANNALLWGSRGTGKSSLVKSLLSAFPDSPLRLLEVEASDLVSLPEISAPLVERPERFVVFVDDLSFEANDPSYKALKAMLDGSVAVAPANMIIYATSNRRHLMPEFQADNQDARMVDKELHQGEAVEEKISLSDRFGLWLAFHPFNQDRYLEIVEAYLQLFEVRADDADECRRQALEWALTRGSRSGRTAWQFARDYAGRIQTGAP